MRYYVEAVPMSPVDNEPYRALVEQAPSLVWRTGATGEQEYFNATWLAFTGRSLDEERGAGWAAWHTVIAGWSTLPLGTSPSRGKRRSASLKLAQGAGAVRASAFLMEF